MPVVSIHDLPKITRDQLNNNAEIMINNSDTETVQANRITKTELLASVAAQIANLDGDIVEIQTDLEAHTYLTSIAGYDAAKTQVLKNLNGTLTWVEEA